MISRTAKLKILVLPVMLLKKQLMLLTPKLRPPPPQLPLHTKHAIPKLINQLKLLMNSKPSVLLI